MAFPTVEMEVPSAERVEVSEDTLRVDLSDGRSLSVPLAWFPRLAHATAAERDRFRLIGRGEGIHWEELDEDVSVEGLLAGREPGLLEGMAGAAVGERLTAGAWRAARSPSGRAGSVSRGTPGRCARVRRG